MSNPLVATPKIIYVLVAEREAFDLIDLHATDHGPRPRGHVLSKTVEQHGVRVIFQHWLQ